MLVFFFLMVNKHGGQLYGMRYSQREVLSLFPLPTPTFWIPARVPPTQLTSSFLFFSPRFKMYFGSPGSSLLCLGFSLLWLLLLQSLLSSRLSFSSCGSQALEHRLSSCGTCGLSCPEASEILLGQGLNSHRVH